MGIPSKARSVELVQLIEAEEMELSRAGSDPSAASPEPMQQATTEFAALDARATEASTVARSRVTDQPR